MSNLIKAPEMSGKAITLAVDKAEAKKQIIVLCDNFHAKATSMWDDASTLLVSAVVHCVNNSYDTSLLSKALESMKPAGIGTGSYFATTKSVLEKLGFDVDYDGEKEKKKSHNNKIVIKAGDVKANVTGDEVKSSAFWKLVYDCAYGDGLKAHQTKPDMRPKSERGASKKADGPSNVISRSAGEALAVESGTAEVLTEALTIDEEHTKFMAEQSERILEALLQCQNKGNVKQVVDNFIKKLADQPKLDSMVAKLSAEQKKAA